MPNITTNHAITYTNTIKYSADSSNLYCTCKDFQLSDPISVK